MTLHGSETIRSLRRRNAELANDLPSDAEAVLISVYLGIDSCLSHEAHGGRASFGRREASQQAWIVARFPRVVMLGSECFSRRQSCLKNEFDLFFAFRGE